jgi:magnesium-transporting ATPase (P-type)
MTTPDAQLELSGSGSQGLTSGEAAERRRRYGPNRVPEAPPPSRLELLVRQLANPMVVLLGLAATVSLAIGEWLDSGGVIVAIALANTALGYFQEGRAEGASRRLKKMMTPTAHVVKRFDVVPLSPGQVWATLALAVVPFLAAELFKALLRRRRPAHA